MNLYHLKTFFYTAKYGSYTKAADVLCITQPAVTRQIQELQSTYDLILFNKVGKKVILTDAGEALYILAEKIFEIETQVEETVRDFQHQKSGKIRISTAETFGAYYLPEVIINFNQKLPDIFVSVDTFNDYHVVENVSTLEYDLGFLSKEMEHPKIVVKQILEESLIMVVNPLHPYSSKKIIEPKELDNIPIIMPETESGTRNVLNEFQRKYNIKFDVVCEVSNSDSVKTLVQNGMGITIISSKVVEKEIAKGDLVHVKINAPELKRKYFLTYHKEKYFTKIMNEFIEITYKWTKEYMKSIFK
ncbi:MAG: LysR family transcriptional regulator [Spirochaetaceae bacterium]|nr:LysR family transcriptional regulator [Spirochaetaceae bacterium]